MDRNELEARTKAFSIGVIRFVSAVPRSRESDVLARQLLRSGTSIGANYREANRAESRADFVHKIGIVEKESAETQYWLELFLESGLASEASVLNLLGEVTELLKIFTAANRSAKRKR